MFRLRELKNNRGNSIVSILCLIAVAVAAIQISYLGSLGNMKILKGFKTTSSRNALITNIADNVSMIATYRNSLSSSLSASENVDLKTCILGSATGGTCQAGVDLPIALYTKALSTSGTSIVLKKITGTGPETSSTANPVVYKADGSICTPSMNGQYSSDCYIQVFTTFKAICAGGTTSCAVADSISVRYIIKNRPGSSNSNPLAFSNFATVDQTTAQISRISILPSLFSSSSTNIAVNTMSGIGTTTTTTTTTSTMTPEQLAAIQAQYPGIDPYIVKALLDGGFSDPAVVTEIANGLIKRNFTDLTYINTIASAYTRNTPSYFLSMVDGLIENKVTDLAIAKFMAEGNIYISTWMSVVIAAGDYSNPYMSAMLRGRIDPDQYVPIMTLIRENGMATDNLIIDIAETGLTDMAVFKQLYDTFNEMGDWFVWGPILESKITDVNKVNQILAAISDINDSAISGAIAGLGTTDKTTANTLYSLVAGLNNSYAAADIIKNNNGDIEAIKLAVANYSPSTITTTATTETNDTKSAVDPTSQTDMLITTTNGSETPPPTDVTLVNTCTGADCPAVSF